MKSNLHKQEAEVWKLDTKDIKSIHMVKSYKKQDLKCSVVQIELGMVRPSVVPLLFRIDLAILSILFFSYEVENFPFKIDLNFSINPVCSSSIEIHLDEDSEAFCLKICRKGSNELSRQFPCHLLVTNPVTDLQDLKTPWPLHDAQQEPGVWFNIQTFYLFYNSDNRSTNSQVLSSNAQKVFSLDGIVLWDNAFVHWFNKTLI
ncbi:hypothetical protein STEG23_031332, partial [Scotinomys teguina]